MISTGNNAIQALFDPTVIQIIRKERISLKTKFGWLLNFLVWLLKSENSRKEIFEKQIDVIVPISYTTLPDQLTSATKTNLIEVISYKCGRSPVSHIIFSNCSYTFPGSARVEFELKKKTLQEECDLCRFACAGDMISSITEAERIKEKIEELKIIPKCILVVTGQMHSRSARIIWGKVFPDTCILITCIHHSHEYQENHPVKMQRGGWIWFFANQARLVQVVAWMCGFKWVTGWHHDTVEKK